MNDARARIGEKAYLVDRVLFLNGLTRSGKFLLGKLVGAIETVEHFQYVSVLEHLPFLHAAGLVSEDAAIALMRLGVDEHTYNYAIGRNLNSRFSDASSIYNSPLVEQYLSRSLATDPAALIEAFQASRGLPCFIIHETMPNMAFVYRAFPQGLVIDLQRHPVDLIASWFRRGWGQRHAHDPLSFAPVMQGGQLSIPWFAHSWQAEYEAASPMERVVQSVVFLLETGERALAALPQAAQARMIRISYEALVEDTEPTVRRLAEFVGAPLGDGFGVVAARERVPRPLPASQRQARLAEIKSLASVASVTHLDELCRRYEKEFGR